MVIYSAVDNVVDYVDNCGSLRSGWVG